LRAPQPWQQVPIAEPFQGLPTHSNNHPESHGGELPALTKMKIKSLLTSMAGTVTTAILTLVYLRLAIRGFSPSDYGISATWLGAQALMRGLLSLPILQMFLFHPMAPDAEERRSLDRTIVHGMLLVNTLGTAGVLGIFYIFSPTRPHWLLGGLLVGLLALTEGLRSLGLSYANMRERHGRWALLNVGEAALRVAFLYAVIRLGIAQHPAYLLLIPAMCAAIAALILGGPIHRLAPRGVRTFTIRSMFIEQKTFLLTIMALSTTAWVTGLADRYFLIKWAGPRTTGLYSGLYGLFGTPMPLLLSSVTLVFRPILALVPIEERGGDRYRKVYRQYLISGAAAVLALSLGLWLARPLLLRWLLRPEYQEIMGILPWILAGQTLMALGQIFELEFYLRNRMGLLLAKQILAGTSSLVFMGILIPRHGIMGAAIACSLYFTVDFVAGLLLYFRCRRA